MISLKEILADLAKAIVDNPDQVSVTEEKDEEGNILLTLTVAPDDMGMVIGRHGKIAKAIRTVMKAAANTLNTKVTVEIK
jgi:predicted RNA-binding protein YlqC (UPF0109 family)